MRDASQPSSRSTGITRREALSRAGLVAAGVLIGGVPRIGASSRSYPDETLVISQQPTLYHGWPTLTQRKNGELLLVYSGGRESHVCPFGRVEMMRSQDEGRSWTFPQVLTDGPIDDRDAGILETDAGTLLVTTFTSLAFEPILEEAEARTGSDAWPVERLGRWRSARDRITAEDRKRALGVWMMRSTDGGVTWSAPYDCLVSSPHGPIQLSDGSLLYAGKELWRGQRIGVCKSADDGQSWHWLGEFPERPGDDHAEYHEPHAVEAADGRIIGHIRNHNRQNDRHLLQTESSDGGRTWSVPRTTGVWGLPSHLMRLRDDRLLMSYGHRREPLGVQARVSENHGRTWSEPIIISGNGTSPDLGYPTTVQLADGSLLTAWYEVLRDYPRAVLRQRRWILN